MMKKKNQVLVSLSIVALLGGCSKEQVQRDVYNSLEDCLADWQKIELCEADQSTENNSGTNSACRLWLLSLGQFKYTSKQ